MKTNKIPHNNFVSDQYKFYDSGSGYELVKPSLVKLKSKIHNSLNSINMYFKKDHAYFENKNIRCPICGSRKVIKNGFYHSRKLNFTETGQIEVSIQLYKCKSCNKQFQTDLSEIVDKNSNFTHEVKEKSKHLIGTYLGSLHKVAESLKQLFNLSVSHQSIENWLFTPDTFLTYGEGRYSGYYIFDVQWVKVKGDWHYRHTLMDAVSKEVIADKIYKEETKDTVLDFLAQATFNKNIKAITTDLDPKYESIIEKLGFKHQLCIFHAKKNFTKQLEHKNLSDYEYEIAKRQLDSVMDLFDCTDYDDVNEAFQELFFKEKDFLPVVWEILINLILPRYKKFIYHIQDNNIAKTSNLVENLFSKTMPKHRKKHFKTIKSLLKRIHAKNLIWNRNRQKDREKRKKTNKINLKNY